MISEEYKKVIVDKTIKTAGKALLIAFKACDLKEKIEAMIVNDGEEYVLTFYPVEKFMSQNEDFLERQIWNAAIEAAIYQAEVQIDESFEGRINEVDMTQALNRLKK